MNTFTDKDKFQYCAVDESGEVWLFSNKPMIRGSIFDNMNPRGRVDITWSISDDLREEIRGWLELNDWRDSVVSFIEPVSVENAIDIISGHFKPQKLEKYDSVDVNTNTTLDISELSIEQLENLAERVNSRIKDLSTLNIWVNFPVDVSNYEYLIVDGYKLYRCKSANFDTDKNYWRAEGGSYVTSLPIEFIEKIGKSTLNEVQSSLIWNIRNLKGNFDLVKEIQLKVDAYNANNTTV